MNEERIDKTIELNRIYLRLPEGNHWEFEAKESENLFSTFLKIGRGVYQPRESEIRKYNLSRKFFLVEIWKSKVYLTVGSLIETNSTMTIYTDEAIRLGENILILKTLLGIPPEETNFEIFQHKNSKIWLKSKFIQLKNLDLHIGSYKLKFYYDLNDRQEVVLLYCPRCNNQAFYRFEGADPLLKNLNDKYIFKLIENYDKLSARICSIDNAQNLIVSSTKQEASVENKTIVPFRRKKRANFYLTVKKK
jgi:hypothetical protein